METENGKSAVDFGFIFENKLKSTVWISTIRCSNMLTYSKPASLFFIFLSEFPKWLWLMTFINRNHMFLLSVIQILHSSFLIQAFQRATDFLTTSSEHSG